MKAGGEGGDENDMVGWHHRLDGHEFEQDKEQEFQKNIYFCFMDMPKPLTMKITTNHGKFLKRWEYQTT